MHVPRQKNKEKRAPCIRKLFYFIKSKTLVRSGLHPHFIKSKDKTKSVGNEKLTSLPSLASIALFYPLEPTFKLATTLLLLIQDKYEQTDFMSLERI